MVQPSKYTEIFGVTISIVIRFIPLLAALVVLLSKGSSFSFLTAEANMFVYTLYRHTFANFFQRRELVNEILHYFRSEF